ncbi:MAG: extracellular solute-binding protein [Thaumarchaeota archaeon]|nr:extracellular solute-binding protein [Nitrososphaerota archaeon]
MADKLSFSVGVIAILIAAGSIAYTSSAIGGVSNQIDSVTRELSGQLTSQIGPVNSKIAPLASSVNSVKEEQTAIRSLVEQRVGGLEAALQQAQQRLTEAERAAQLAQQELESLQADKALEEAAKKEQAPLIYGVVDAPHFANIIWPRFRESYPWAPAEPRYIEGFAPLRSRFVSEFQANAPSADLIWQSHAPMVGELAPYLATFKDMKYINLYEKAFIGGDGRIFGTMTLPGVIMYNTNIVKTDDVPKSWFDLANPKWKDKIVLQDLRRLEFTTQAMADLQLAMGKDRWTEFMKGFAANNPTLVGSNTEAYVKIIAGEFPIGIGRLNDILAQQTDTPVAVAWPQEEPKGVISGTSMIGISAKAANPNFARLLVQWLMSPQGQKAIADTGRPPTLLTLDHPKSLGSVIPLGVGILPVNEDFLKDPKSWEAVVKSFFG